MRYRIQMATAAGMLIEFGGAFSLIIGITIIMANVCYPVWPEVCTLVREVFGPRSNLGVPLVVLGFGSVVGGQFFGFRFGYRARYHPRYDPETGTMPTRHPVVQLANKLTLTARQEPPPPRYEPRVSHFFVPIALFSLILWGGIYWYAASILIETEASSVFMEWGIIAGILMVFGITILPTLLVAWVIAIGVVHFYKHIQRT